MHAHVHTVLLRRLAAFLTDIAIALSCSALLAGPVTRIVADAATPPRGMVFTSESFDTAFPATANVLNALLDNKTVTACYALTLFSLSACFVITSSRTIVTDSNSIRWNFIRLVTLFTLLSNPLAQVKRKMRILTVSRAVLRYSKLSASRRSLEGFTANYALEGNLLTLFRAPTLGRTVLLSYLLSVLATTMSACCHASIILYEPATV